MLHQDQQFWSEHSWADLSPCLAVTRRLWRRLVFLLSPCYPRQTNWPCHQTLAVLGSPLTSYRIDILVNGSNHCYIAGMTSKKWSEISLISPSDWHLDCAQTTRDQMMMIRGQVNTSRDRHPNIWCEWLWVLCNIIRNSYIISLWFT